MGGRDVEQLRKRALDGGIDGFTYELFGQNLGSAGGSNRLAREATADSLLVLNSDTYPAPDLLAELLASSTTRWSESPRPGRFPSSTRRRST